MKSLATLTKGTLVIALAAVFVNAGYAQTQPKPATEATKAANRALQQYLNFNDRDDAPRISPPITGFRAPRIAVPAGSRATDMSMSSADGSNAIRCRIGSVASEKVDPSNGARIFIDSSRRTWYLRTQHRSPGRTVNVPRGMSARHGRSTASLGQRVRRSRLRF